MSRVRLQKLIPCILLICSVSYVFAQYGRHHLKVSREDVKKHEDALMRDAKTKEEKGIEHNITKKILHDVEHDYGKFHMGRNKQIVLVLGNRGAGKSALSLLLTSDAKSLTFKNGVFGRKDFAGKIKNVAETVVPRLRFDASTGISFYDCPGFTASSRLLARDIVVKRSMYELLNFANELKIVFVVDIASLQNPSNATKFIKLAENAMQFIKDITKYKDGIALIVTKVDSDELKDEDVIKNIVSFLRETKTHLNSTQHHVITFIDALLKDKENNAEIPIDIFRVPIHDGIVDFENNKINVERRVILSMINDDLKFIPINKNDFDFAINNKSDVPKLIDEFENRLKIDVPTIITDIQQEYVAQKVRNSTILDTLKEIFAKPTEIALKLDLLAKITTDEKMPNILENVAFLDFLRTFSDGNEPTQFSVEIMASIDEIYDQVQVHLLDIVIDIIADIELYFEILEKWHHLEMDIMNKTVTLAFLELMKNPPQKFVLKIYEVSKISSMYSLRRKFKRTSRYTEFLQVFNNKQLLTPDQDFKIDTALLLCMSKLNNIGIWYEFLLELRTQLSTYSMQTGDFRNEQLEFINLKNGSNKIAGDIGIERLINLPGISSIVSVKRMELNSYKLKALQKVWQQTMIDRAEILCLPNNRLIVNGFIVVLSEIIKHSCWDDAKSIEIYALSKVFIDAHITRYGQNLNLTIISPVWEVVSQSHIFFSLHGKDELGIFEHAMNGIDSKLQTKRNGQNGKRGMAGGSGGNFLAIGSTFINEQQLQVDVSGGTGSSGQSGGNGTDAVNGISPSANFDENIKNGFICDHTTDTKSKKVNGLTERLTVTTDKYKCNAKLGALAGDGGHGGCGGVGGRPGIYSIIGLKNSPEIEVFKYTGHNGDNGKGGKGGKGGFWGNDIVTIHTETWIPGIRDINNKKTDTYNQNLYGGEILPGKDGQSGEVCSVKLEPVYHQVSPIVKYKAYARKNLANNIWRLQLLEFLNNLNQEESVNSLYKPLNFIEELKDLENDYFKLRKTLNFIPLYQSLQRRIENYSALLADSTDEKKCMILVNTAVTSKIFAIRNNEWHITVVDLLGHLTQMKDDINDLRKTRRSKNIANYRAEYKRSLNEKIHSARELIDSAIQPVIQETFAEIDKKIDKLLDETLDKRKSTVGAMATIFDNKEKLLNSMQWHKIFGAVKLIGTAMSFFGPAGLTAGAGLNGAATFGETITDKMYKPTKVTVPVGPQKEILEKILDDYTNNNVPFLHSIIELNESVTNLTKKDLEGMDKDMIRNATKMVDEIKQITTENSSFTVNRTSMYTKLKEWGEKVVKNDKLYLEAKKKKYEKLEDENSLAKTKGVDAKMKFYNNFLKTFEVAGVAIQLYNKLLNDTKNINEADKQIVAIGDQLVTWKKYEQSIYDLLIPQLQKVQQTLTNANHDNESHAQLDVSKWHLKTTLEQLEKLFREMMASQQSLYESDLIFCVEKIQHGIGTMLSVYDRIDSYLDQEKLADLLANVADPQSIRLNDPEMEKAMIGLNENIISNLILERYEFAVQAVKLQYFPIAQYFLSNYEVVSSQESDNNQTIEDKIVEKVTDLEGKLKDGKTWLMGYDDYMLIDHHFDDSDPIYTWNYQEFKDEIVKLLNGEPVTFKADITKGLNYSALKFKNASLYFKLKNETKQVEFNVKIEKYEISMTAVDKYYFRCDKRVYYVPHDSNIKFGFRINHAADIAYNKITSSNYFISPYTVWKIRLTPAASQNCSKNIDNDLKKYSNEKMDLLLTGTGQYLKTEKYDTTCTDELNKYYKLSFML